MDKCSHDYLVSLNGYYKHLLDEGEREGDQPEINAALA